MAIFKDLLKNRQGDVIEAGEYEDMNDGFDNTQYGYDDIEDEAQTSVGNNSGAIEMKVVKPSGFKIDEAKQYGDLLLSQKTVLLNLESTSLEDARRLLDFLSGVVHAVDGKIEKVGKKTFVATPNNVDVTGSAELSEEEAEVIQ